jgi:tetratricopeptide (TPR) repeat protein
MSGKKSREERKAKERSSKKSNSSEVSWDLIWKVLASIFAFAGSIATVYDLIGKIRSDVRTFTTLIVPGLVIIMWLIVLIQLVRKRNMYVIPLLAVTIIGGIVGGIGWQTYNQTEEDKVIVLVAAFDGPEEKYGLRRQMLEDLQEATKGYEDTVIIEGDDVVTSSESARELGEDEKADLVIWAWYRPTENPNITVHIENLSPTDFITIQESETYQPQASLAQLESFEIQRQLGSETSTLISFLNGMLRFESGDYKAAIEYFEKILEEDDISTLISLYDLFFNLGNSHLALGNHEGAIQGYDEAIELDSQKADAYFNRGISYFVLGQNKRAIEDYDKAIEINPEDASAYINRGNLHADLGQDERAIEDYDKAIEINPEDAVYYYNRGVSYADLEQHERAIEDFDKVIEVNPELSDAYYNRGRSYAALGQNKRAIEDYDKVIEINPEDASAYINRGNLHADLGQDERAIEDFDKAIEINPEDAVSYYNRGISYLALGQYERALEDFDKAIEINPEFLVAYTNRGVSYFALGQYEQAIEDFDKVIEINPEDATAYYNRGLLHAKLGKTAEAEADFKKYEELTGQKP